MDVLPVLTSRLEPRPPEGGYCQVRPTSVAGVYREQEQRRHDNYDYLILWSGTPDRMGDPDRVRGFPYAEVVSKSWQG